MRELKERYEQLQAARSRAWRAGDDFDEALIEAEIATLQAQMRGASQPKRSGPSHRLPEHLRRAVGASR